MNNNPTNKKLLPKIRFPEFRDDGEWELPTLKNLTLKIGSGITPKGGAKNYKEKGRPFVRSQNIGWGILLLDNIVFIDDETHFTFPNTEIKINDVFLNITGASIGRSALANEFALGGNVNQHVCIIRVIKDKLYPNLLNQILISQIGQKQIESFQAGGNREGLNFGQIRSFNIPIPSTLPEQQKIADCLSSLDAIIEASNEKLNLLKTHKKGLLQQLFPTEGEKIPKLRFPEFKNDGVWQKSELKNIGKPLMCKRIFKEQTISSPINSVPFYKIGTFGKEPDSFIPIDLFNEYKAKFSFPNTGDILISASGTIGRLVVYNGSNAYFQDSNIVWIGNDEAKITNAFLYYCYSILKWQTSDGGIVKRLYNSNLNSMEICFPKNRKEQQKIADCLTAIDNEIEAQADKIEILKLHKKGLMQQLFPTLNEET